MENNTNETLQGNTGNDSAVVTGLQTNYPIILNHVEYLYFKTWNITLNDSVLTHETEAGTQEDVVTRKGRRSIAVSVTCLQPLVAQLLSLASLEEFVAQIYDPLTDDYDTMNVRIGAGSMSYSLKERSAELPAVNGVWTVSFTLEEF